MHSTNDIQFAFNLPQGIEAEEVVCTPQEVAQATTVYGSSDESDAAAPPDHSSLNVRNDEASKYKNRSSSDSSSAADSKESDMSSSDCDDSNNSGDGDINGGVGIAQCEGLRDSSVSASSSLSSSEVEG